MLAISYLLEFHRTDSRILDPYMSKLIDLLPAIVDNDTRGALYSLVEGSVITSGDSVKKLNYFFELIHDPSMRVRLNATIRLSEIDGSITNGIPVLIQALTNRFSVGSAFAYPFPVGSLRYDQIVDGVQERAHTALATIDPQLAARYRHQD